MAALLADKPARAPRHRPEVVTQRAIWTSNNFVSHFKPSVLLLSGSIRQFDPVGMLLITLVLFSKNLFQPMRLLCRAPSIRKRQSVAYHELLAAGIAPQDPHLLKTIRLILSRLAFLYCYCPHVLNFSRTRGLSQPSHDDEQGADQADDDQHSETDPHPLLGRPVFPDHFGSRFWSAT
jgi:hypothetical protein